MRKGVTPLTILGRHSILIHRLITQRDPFRKVVSIYNKLTSKIYLKTKKTKIGVHRRFLRYQVNERDARLG